MKKILFIYNPVSGTGIVRKKMFEIVEYYNSNECLVTMCPVLKLEELKREDFEGYDRVVVSGGDGTLNNFITFTGKMELDFPISYIPAGSTNDFAATLGLTGNLMQALETSINGREQAVDMGQFNNANFLYVAAFGIFTKVVYTTPQEIKNIMGYSAYILEGIKAVSDLTTYNLKLTIDDKYYEGDFLLGLVTNSLSVGGMKNRASVDMALDDGMFEVLFVRAPKNIIELNKTVAALAVGKPEDSDNIIIDKGAHITVEHDITTAWTLDGEYGGEQRHVDISILKRKFKIIV
ncbi:MAG: YegS/Rv2252/BmrU family lipid kinase [Lachnospiraceae bacterium]|nr:YegS/Rv2252/BmrU family lipid kinase [Lachnospiraceae bacterium]